MLKFVRHCAILMGRTFQNITIQDSMGPIIHKQDIITPVIKTPTNALPIFNLRNQEKNIFTNKNNFLKKDFPVKHDSVTKSIIDPFEVAVTNVKESKESNFCFYENHFEKMKIMDKKIDPLTVKTIIPEKIDLKKTESHYFEGKFDWIIGIIILMIMMVAILRMYYGKILSQTFKSTVNIQSARKLIAEKSSLIQKASVILSIIYFFGTSLFLFECIIFYKISIFGLTGIKLFLACFISVLLFYFIKNLLYWISGVFVASENDILETLSNYNIFYRTLGIIILPIIFSIPYVPEYVPEILIYSGLGLFGFIFILRIIRGFVISFRIKLSLFYSFLYFCVLEILPMLYLFMAYKEIV